MEIQDFIIKFKAQLENDRIEIAPETNYAKEAFWDSLTSMVISVMIEDDYHLQISPEQVNEYNSVQELFDDIASKKK